jgi:hypothetical protein
LLICLTLNRYDLEGNLNPSSQRFHRALKRQRVQVLDVNADSSRANPYGEVQSAQLLLQGLTHQIYASQICRHEDCASKRLNGQYHWDIVEDEDKDENRNDSDQCTKCKRYLCLHIAAAQGVLAHGPSTSDRFREAYRDEHGFRNSIATGLPNYKDPDAINTKRIESYSLILEPLDDGFGNLVYQRVGLLVEEIWFEDGAFSPWIDNDNQLRHDHPLSRWVMQSVKII